MSVTPRRSWPTNDGAHSQGGSDSQRAHPSTGNIHHQAHHPAHGNRPSMTSAAAHTNNNSSSSTTSSSSNTSAANNNLPSHMESSSAQKSSSHAGQGSLKPPLPPPVMTPQQQQQPTQQQQSLPHQQQQVRPLTSTASNNLPPGSSSLFSPPSATSLPSMADMQQQQQHHHLLQPNLFVNGQSDMNQQQPPGYPGGSSSHMAHVKQENQTASGGQYDFQSRMDIPMNDFDQHQKDMMQMSGDNLFNSLAQQQQHPIHHSQSLGDVKSMALASNVSSPAMSMPVSGGKPKSHSAAMAQVRNASSWSSLAASTPAGSSKSSNIGDSFQMFKRQAKEKEARQKALIEQQEMRRQQKEQAERERMRAEADRRREREEEEALENARYFTFFFN